MNQSAEPTLWPLISVCVSDGAVPRMLTRLASAKAPSPPEFELMLTPGRRCTVSATFLAGSLPMSSAVTTSTTASAPFLLDSDDAYDARMPLTSTTCTSATGGTADAAGWGAGAACCAKAGAIAPDISSAADAKGFKRKDMAASKGGYRSCGVSVCPRRWDGRMSTAAVSRGPARRTATRHAESTARSSARSAPARSLRACGNRCRIRRRGRT